MSESESIRAPLRVLFVDDDPAILVVLRYVYSGPSPDLKNNEVFSGPFEVFTAESGEEALAMLDAPPDGKPFDAIVVDQRMPGLVGVEVCARAMREHPNVVRVLMTAFGDYPELLRTLGELNICHVVHKPFGKDSQLHDAIFRALDEQRNRLTATSGVIAAVDPLSQEREAMERFERAVAISRAARTEMRSVGESLRTASRRPR